MSIEIPTRVGSAPRLRWRKPGGLYLIAGAPAEPCPLLPVALHVCPTCGEGLKPARSWTWVDADKLLGLPLQHPAGSPPEHPARCPLGHRLGRAGLLMDRLEAFYPTPQAFMEEAARAGISRLITAVPREFQRGRTWVLCAHRSAIAAAPGADPTAGVFTLFRPTAVEYVVRGDESDAESSGSSSAASSPCASSPPSNRSTGWNRTPERLAAAPRREVGAPPSGAARAPSDRAGAHRLLPTGEGAGARPSESPIPAGLAEKAPAVPGRGPRAREDSTRQHPCGRAPRPRTGARPACSPRRDRSTQPQALTA